MYLFDFDIPYPSVTRPLCLIVIFIVTVHITNLMLLNRIRTDNLYNHQAYLIDDLACAFSHTLGILRKRGSSSNKQAIGIDYELNGIWINFEHLSALNPSIAVYYGWMS